MTNEKRQKAVQDITAATIECINEHGLIDTTIRKISAIAGVNSAAISYYFGSRDELVTKALEISLDNAFDFDDFKYNANDSYREVLKAIFRDWKQGVIAYPGMFHAHMDDLTNRHINSSITRDRINAFIEKAYQELTEHGLVDNELNFKKLKLIFGAFIATLTMPDTAYPLNSNDEIEVLIEML